jgi:adenosylcobinamide-GDP ribazoletransferase
MKFDFQRMRESLRGTFQQGSQPSGGPRGSFNFLEQVRELTSAIQFLTIVPVPSSRRLFAMQDDASSHVITGSGYFSLVGFVIGLITCLIPFLFGSLLPSFVLAALAIIVLVILSGGLHLDGLIDTCDGVFGRLDRVSRLEIMRDSRVGSFGLLGAACILLLKFALLGSLSVNLFFPALLIAPAISRWCVVLAMRLFPSARSDGMGDEFRQSITTPYLVLSGIIALLVALIFGRIDGLLMWLGASALAILLGAWMTRTLGGLSGDVGGAIVEVTEVAALLLFLLFQFLY